jgi:hypothetical protein
MKSKKALSAISAITVAAALATAAPAIGASGRSGDPQASIASAQAANARLAGIPKAIQAATIRQQLRRLKLLVSALRGDVDSIKKLIPVVASSLTQLGDSVKALATGGQQLATAFLSVEYGVIGLFNGTNRIATLTSSDIPDDGNATSVSGSIPVVNGTGSPMTLTIKAAIKSGETDGTGPSDPAGQVGGILYATCMSPPGAPFNQTCGGVSQTGALVCTPAGPPSLHEFDLPDGTTTKQNLENVPFRYSRTNSSVPQFADTNAAGDGNPSPNSCALPPFGVYNVQVSASFVDIPTSLSPGPSD